MNTVVGDDDRTLPELRAALEALVAELMVYCIVRELEGSTALGPPSLAADAYVERAGELCSRYGVVASGAETVLPPPLKPLGPALETAIRLAGGSARWRSFGSILAAAAGAATREPALAAELVDLAARICADVRRRRVTAALGALTRAAPLPARC